MEKVCEYCGDSYKTDNSKRKYCSRKCVEESQKRRVTVKCNVCLKDFELKKSSDRNTKHCSMECRRKGKYHKLKNEIEFLTEEEKFDKKKKEFYKKVIENGDNCWGWKGNVDAKGYARLCLSSKFGDLKAYRFSWIMHNGPIPEGLLIRHICNNPICTNIKHLSLGTYKDNCNDKVKAGTQLRGEKNPSSKLKDSDVRTIKLKLKKGIKAKALSKEYHVSIQAIYDIKNNKQWKHITLEE